MNFASTIRKVSTYPLKLHLLSIFPYSSMVRALSWNAPQLKFDFVFYAILNFTLFIFMFGYFHILFCYV